jgi:hypothetical protein
MAMKRQMISIHAMSLTKAQVGKVAECYYFGKHGGLETGIF